MKPILTVLLLFIPSMLSAGSPDDQAALGDLKSIAIVCDVNVGEANLLLRRLELIDETYTQLLDAGVQPTIVVAIRGGASRYVTRGEAYVDAADLPVKAKIQGWIDQFQRNGFRMEQCAIAAKTWKIALGDILPAVAIVQNGYISLAAYQARGYALLPMD